MTRVALFDRVSGLSIPGKLAPIENWHLTLRFLGDIDQVTLERFLSRLQVVEAERVFDVALDRMGAFPRARKATVVWVGVRGGEERLARLNEIAEEAAVAAGLAAEERPFHPHVTLSRVRPPADVRDLEGVSVDVGWRCHEVVVYRSHLGGGPARYEPLETFELTG